MKSETWYQTEKPLTVQTRMIAEGQKYWLAPNIISLISTVPYGLELRSNVLDPLMLKDEPVVWRNYEASYDVAQLEPSTPRLLFTYVLQEYFVPVEKFTVFVPKLREVFLKHGVNVINVSIRHALPDTETLLSWAPTEVFSFVVYHKQATLASSQKQVGIWTRELIDHVLSVGGRYYLPYQIHATETQFKTAYPGHKDFFALKQKLDPANKFRNKLWDRYYRR